MQLVLLCAALFVIAASVFDWDWFFYERKAVFFTERFGRGGARIFYGFLGVVLLIMSYLLHKGVQAQASAGF